MGQRCCFVVEHRENRKHFKSARFDIVNLWVISSGNSIVLIWISYKCEYQVSERRMWQKLWASRDCRNGSESSENEILGSRSGDDDINGGDARTQLEWWNAAQMFEQLRWRTANETIILSLRQAVWSSDLLESNQKATTLRNWLAIRVVY